MIRVNHTKEPQVSSKPRSGGRLASFEQQLDAVGKQFADLSQVVNAGCFAIASVLPKGKLEVVRIEMTCLDRRDGNNRVVDDLKLYAEASAWPALRDNRPASVNGTTLDAVVGVSPVRSLEQRPQIAAAPLPDAIFEGYPGVLLAYRNHDDRRFSAEDLERLATAARELSESFRKARQQNETANAAIAVGEMPANQRFIPLDADGRPWMKSDEFNSMDEQLRSNLLEAVSKLSRAESDEPRVADLAVADSLNRLRTVRIVIRSSTQPQFNGHNNPTKSKKDAASSNPQVLCCFTPPASDWMRLRPNDFTADVEIKRLIPAINFMTRDVGNQPGLYEIADSVNLSPFHFHRRFTELFGVTPKHLLLSAQIAHARQLLSQPEQALAEIARVCGFAHQSHFTSRFKQATGLTPTRWRRVLNAEVADETVHGT